jgi:hypothetical protein
MTVREKMKLGQIFVLGSVIVACLAGCGQSGSEPPSEPTNVVTEMNIPTESDTDEK